MQDSIDDELDRLHDRMADSYEDALDVIKYDPINDLEHLSRDELFRAYKAVQFANYLGFVFNVELTVNWQQEYRDVGVIDDAYRSFIDRFKQFVRHRNLPEYYWCVFECTPSVGLHSHSGLVIPRQRYSEFKTWLRNTLTGPSGQRFAPGSVTVCGHKNDHVFGQWAWFRYGFKSANPRLERREHWALLQDLTLNKLAGLPYKKGGYVPFKRVRICRALGPAAQARVDFKRPLLPGVPEDQRYSDHEYRTGQSDRIYAERAALIRKLEVL